MDTEHPRNATKERFLRLPTESATPQRGAASTSATREEPTKAANTRRGPAAEPVGGPAESEKKRGTRTGGDSGDAPEPSTESDGRALSGLSPLAPRASARATGTGTTVAATVSGTAAATTARIGKNSLGVGRDPDVLTHTGTAQGAARSAAVAAEGETRTAAGRGGARAFLRGTHRTMLTVAAVTGVVLVAGVLVGLRGGGATHAGAAPDPAASLLAPGSDGGPQAGVPVALPLPSGRKSGDASPGRAGDSHPGDGKHVGSAAAGKGSHGSSSTSDNKGDHQTGGGTSSSSAGQDTEAATAASRAPAAPASSGSSGSSGVAVFSHASGRCVTVTGGQGKDGSPLQIQDCSGSAAQQWAFASDGTIRAFGLCMDAAGASTANGTVVQLANCNGGPAQQFRLNSSHDLVSVLADKCVDVKDGQTANGALQLWSCAGTDNQKWSKR
ncbi:MULTISPECIES: ricin-type beta-trefoil lectin domain protein [unclassified Streptomyces]|uniref:ricin-type beta-trefoil lectin domain protein n=1 Tax=unclassified Streptomyces TaxID=2593676 RepID=UPI0036E5B35F